MSRSLGIFLGALLLMLCSGHLFAQGTFTVDMPSQFLGQFQAAMSGWLARIRPFADSLFYFLALCDVIYTAATLVLEGVDFHAWSAGLIRTILRIGFFLVLLRYAANWVPAIVTSFAQLGKTAAGVTSLAPSDVFAQGLQIAGNLFAESTTQGLLFFLGTNLLVVLCCLVIVIAFAIITLSLIMTWVEAYLCMSVAFVLLGFGGSRWTQEYAARVLSMAVSVGIRLLVVYVIVATGQSLTGGWANQAANINTTSMPAMSAFSIMAACVLLCLCAWHLPKLAATALGYGPSLGHGEVVAMTAGILSLGSRVAIVGARGGAGVGAAASG